METPESPDNKETLIINDDLSDELIPTRKSVIDKSDNSEIVSSIHVETTTNLLELPKNTKKFTKIIRNYKSIQDNLDNIQEDILKLEKIHSLFVSQVENKIRFREYGSYIDDIFYQLKLLKIEYDCQTKIHNNNIVKLYKDLYRLYSKVIKKLISMKLETNNQIVGSKVKKQLDEKIHIDKMQYFQKIKPFNEIADNHINIEDCITLYKEFDIRINDIVGSIQDILKSIDIAEEQKFDGLLLQTYLISMNSEKEKALIEKEVFEKLLKGILLCHIDISNKYLERTNKISKEIINDSEKIKDI
jgi:hypothetical protein